jgi:predicted DsbA family dithiol-disulfide isomerase
MPTTIEIYADFTCPWCYIGLSRLKKLEQERSIRLHWNPYLLRPDIPANGIPLDSILPAARLERSEAAVREATRAAGLTLNRPERVPNTLHAHEIGFLAETKGLDDVYHRAIFSAYFTQAQNIGDPEVLGEIGEAIGLTRDEINEVLQTGRYRAEVGRATADAFERGIRSVPNYIFANGRGFSGALPYDAFVNALDAVNEAKVKG